MAKAYQCIGDSAHAAEYAARAQARIEAIRRLMWDAQDGVFTDYLWTRGKTTGNVTAATLYPLFLNVATAQQAQTVAGVVYDKLLQPGGLGTTLVNSGQQWDVPNGWAPLQWIAVVGLRNFGYEALAQQIASRWVEANISVYRLEGNWWRNTTLRPPTAPPAAAANTPRRSALAGPTACCWRWEGCIRT